MRPAADLLAEAVKDLHKAETIERAVSRIVRRHGGTYPEYLEIIGEVRDLARKEKITPLQAARKIAQL